MTTNEDIWEIDFLSTSATGEDDVHIAVDAGAAGSAAFLIGQLILFPSQTLRNELVALYFECFPSAEKVAEDNIKVSKVIVKYAQYLRHVYKSYTQRGAKRNIHNFLNPTMVAIEEATEDRHFSILPLLDDYKWYRELDGIFELGNFPAIFFHDKTNHSITSSQTSIKPSPFAS